MDNQQQEIIQSEQKQTTLKNAPHIPNPLKANGITFENDFGKKPLFLAHLTSDQGIIIVLSLAGAFVGAAIAGVPLFAVILAAGINDIKYANSDSDSDKTESDNQTQAQLDPETIDVPVTVVPEERIDSSPGAGEQTDPQPTVEAQPTRLITGTVTPTLTQPPNVTELRQLPMRERAYAILTHLSKSGFDLSRAIADQITCICGNQRGGKGTLMAILAILSSAIDPATKVHYFTAGDDIYPFSCDRLVCRLSYPSLDGDEADSRVAASLYQYLKDMDKLTQGACKDIILVIDEAVALSDYLDPDQKQWMIRFLLTRANKKGAQIFIVLHGINLTSWVGTGNAGGFSQTFKTGATFIGCEASSQKIHPLRSISVATGHYFLATPDDFSKPLPDGELGTLPDWMKSEINPSTGQPDPARTLLTFFPELIANPVKASEKKDATEDIRERLEVLIKATPQNKTLPQSETALKLLEIIRAATKYPISFESIRKSRKWENTSPDKATLLRALNELSQEWIRGNEEEGYYLRD
jgi:hypothetical protein